MELVIWKKDSTFYTKVFETYTKGDKKEALIISSKNALGHAIKLAYTIITNYKWLKSSNIAEKSIAVISNKKYYKAKVKK